MYEELRPNFNQRSAGEGFLLNPNDETLRKDLESELRLDRGDIRSYAWYHGKLPRDIAEHLIKNDGDFLIRESISSAGEHVLTMRWNGASLHFKINHYPFQQGAYYSKIQYGFERESFDSIPALITHHVGNRIPISMQTGAVIRTPINRDLPLSYSDVRYASLRRTPKPNGASVSAQSPPSQVPAGLILTQTFNHPQSPFNQPQYPFNQTLSPGTGSLTRRREGDGLVSSPQPFPLHLPAANPTIPDTGKKAAALSSSPKHVPEHPLDRLGPLPEVQHKSRAEVPPKPSRIPSFRRPVIKHNSSKSRKGKSKSEEENIKPSTGSSTSHSSSVTTLLTRSGSPPLPTNTSRTSIFKPTAYVSDLLPEQNKPVDGDAMEVIKTILLGTDSFKLARHLTLVDCEVCRMFDCGLMDIFLAKGKQFRCDLLERYQTFAFWVAVCILRGSTSKQDRVDILNVFIKVANELVHSLGNVFGFSAIMHGLLCPQIRGLDDSWLALQQQYTNNAVTMEKKLVPLIQLLDEGKGQISVASTCIPHILPLLRYFENPLEAIPHLSPATKSFNKKQLSASEGNMLGSVASDKNESTHWWRNLPNDSFDSLMSQLSIARNVILSLQELRGNALAKFQDFEKKPNIHEMFSTDFHLRLLWGAKGSESPQEERYEKFDKLITLMSKRPVP